MVSARPILYSPAMVQARHAGAKTQTRRPVTNLLRFGKITEFGRSDTRGYDWHFRDKRMLWNDLRHDALLRYCPYGKPGDLLWCREPWFTVRDLDHLAPRDIPRSSPIWYAADGNPPREAGKTRPGRYLCRWMSRSTDRITEIRVPRLQDINGADAKAEGAEWVNPPAAMVDEPTEDVEAAGYVIGFMGLWDSINGKNGHDWKANDWVFALSFETVLANVDSVLEQAA